MTDPYDSAEYQAFVESMAQYCQCEYDSPCDGVLAGGICDQKKRRSLADDDAEEQT